MLMSKVAIVTGGGSGIGRAICKKLATSGARLIVADLDETIAQNTAKNLVGSGHNAFQMDVSKDSTLLKMSYEQWRNVMDVNLNSVFMLSQMVARESITSQSSLSIVNISSIVGKVGNFGQCNYSATKAGVIGFTKSAARELATKNIRVNSILPGFIRTPMTEAMPPKVLETMISMVPQRRLGEPEEIANAVLFLASNMSSYVTGTTLEVTGGLGM